MFLCSVMTTANAGGFSPWGDRGNADNGAPAPAADAATRPTTSAFAPWPIAPAGAGQTGHSASPATVGGSAFQPWVRAD